MTIWLGSIFWLLPHRYSFLSLPTRQLANGVVDAFVHVMEQYLTYPVNAQVQDLRKNIGAVK
jgi:alcohol dehydrogenase YqhD (iron-dependent ADH family)